MSTQELGSHPFFYAWKEQTNEPRQPKTVQVGIGMQNVGIAHQFFAVLIKGVHCLFGLGEKAAVRLKRAEAYWVIDVQNRNACRAQGLSKQHVLIAIGLDALVKRVRFHDPLCH